MPASRPCDPRRRLPEESVYPGGHYGRPRRATSVPDRSWPRWRLPRAVGPMNDNITINSAELIAVIGTITGAVGILFRTLMAEMTKSYNIMLAEKDKQIAEITRLADLRYADMRADRDFQMAARARDQETILTAVTVTKEGVLAMRTILERQDAGQRLPGGSP